MNRGGQRGWRLQRRRAACSWRFPCWPTHRKATPLATGDELTEVVIQAQEPRYVAPTRRDRIGRVWVPVFINDRGPFRLVLDSGATNSAVIPRVAQELGLSTADSPRC